MTKLAKQTGQQCRKVRQTLLLLAIASSSLPASANVAMELQSKIAAYETCIGTEVDRNTKNYLLACRPILKEALSKLPPKQRANLRRTLTSEAKAYKKKGKSNRRDPNG